MPIGSKDFCKRSPNGRHDWMLIGIIKESGKQVKYYICNYCGDDKVEPLN